MTYKPVLVLEVIMLRTKDFSVLVSRAVVGVFFKLG